MDWDSSTSYGAVYLKHKTQQSWPLLATDMNDGSVRESKKKKKKTVEERDLMEHHPSRHKHANQGMALCVLRTNL